MKLIRRLLNIFLIVSFVVTISLFWAPTVSAEDPDLLAEAEWYWSPNLKIPNQSTKAPPALAYYNGKLHMVHLGSSSNSIYHSTFDNIKWSPNVTISNQYSKAAPALAVYNGKLHIVHLGSSSNDIWHSYYNGSTWSTNVRVLSHKSNASPAIAAYGSKLHMVHKGESSTNIYHSSYNGSSWTDHGKINDQSSKSSPAIATYNGPMHIVHQGASSNQLWHSLYLEKICAVPSYQPDYWNYYTYIRSNNNCYNYGNNKRTDTYAQPGRASGQSFSLNCTSVGDAAVSDGISRISGTSCPSGEMKIALAIAPGWDYHWYRRDSNGYWSHKPGGTYATNLDNSGNLITNPESADRGYYTDFCGYFCTCSDDLQGIGHEVVRFRAITTGTQVPEGSIKKGLKITIMIFSGYPNPSFLLSAKDRDNIGMLDYLLSLLDNNNNFRGETVMPVILGYNGIVIERFGKVKGFHYEKMIIYRENIEIESYETSAKEFLYDGGQNLEDFLLQVAVEKGALNSDMLRIIK